MVPKKIKLSKEEKARLITSIKRIAGQLESILDVVETDKVSNLTLVQLLAVKGGATRICKDIIAFGVIPHLSEYSPKDIDQALNIIFKIDS